MLRQTFIHLPQVGKVTEVALWDAGVVTCEAFTKSSWVPSRIRGRRDEHTAFIKQCMMRLDESDGAFFQACLPAAERWRVYADFRHHAAFLDIETTGLSPEYSELTMVGILDSDGYTAYVRDENLDDLPDAINKYDLIVTYNGRSFDIPYVEYFFGHIFDHAAHLDLRYPLRRLGYGGGLKSIEQRLGVGRPSELSGLSGFDAVLMWRMWERGDAGARDTLIRYNAEDVASLPGLAEIAYNRLLAELPAPVDPIDRWPRVQIDLPFDMEVVGRLAARAQPNEISSTRYI